MSPSETVDEIEALYRAQGSELYGERVSLLEHSILTAHTAQQTGAADALVVAALLHDIGHLLEEPDDAFGSHSHDQIGGNWLADRFPKEISEPVRLHVAAKRYLCAVDPTYHSRLSPASQFTLNKQGGPMSTDEADEFASREFADDAVRLRRWEDGSGKDPADEILEFSHFRHLIEQYVGDQHDVSRR